MTRVNVLLLLALIASGLYLVRTQYEARRLYAQLDRAQAEQRRLDTELDRLQLDKRAQATSLRVEQLARDRLGMRPASPAVTQYVTVEGAAPAAAQGRP